MTHLFTIARLEFVSAARLKWIRLLTVAFALLTAAAAFAAGAASELTGAEGFERTTMTLVPIVLVLVPIAAIVLGITGQVVEAGTDPFLFAQPIGRAAILVARWLGQAAALGSAIVAGLGIGALCVVTQAGAEGLAGFAAFAVLSALLGIIFLSIAAAIAAATDRRATALGVGIFGWFFFVLLYDAAALSAAGWISGAAGGRLLFGSVFGNPADLVRVASLSVAGTPNVLGAAGDAWVRFLGGAHAAIGSATLALAAWTAAPLAVGVRLLAARDL